MLTFKNFVTETIVTKQGILTLNEGIEHIEALPNNEFIKAIETLSNFIVSEKLDGANLIFGFDSKGKFYTSREAKGGERKYTIGDYENRAANNGFKGAHQALQAIKPELKQVVDNGEAVEVEVLYGRQPNAIVYGSNYIAFLRILPGDKKQVPDQSKVKQLGDILKGKKVAVSVQVITTDDGVEIKQQTIKQEWNFTSVSYINAHHFAKVDVSRELAKFKKWLATQNPVGNLNLTNGNLITVSLVSVPKEVREQVKIEREKLITDASKQFKLPIKEKFLDEVLRVLKPALRDVSVEPHENIGVEGVVFLNPKTLEQFKIVDKDIFTIINQFNYAIRNEIKSTARGRPKFEATLGREGLDIFGQLLKRIADVVGIEGLGEYVTIARTLHKYVGATPTDTLNNITKAFATSKVNTLKPAIASVINESLVELTSALEKYNSEWQTYNLPLKTGKNVRYTDEIHHRTLMVFAEAREEMKEMLKGVQKAKTPADIAVALYGKQLKSLH